MKHVNLEKVSMVKFLHSLVFIMIAAMVSGCAVQGPANPGRTSRREIEDAPANRVLDKPSVQDFRIACDQMARDIVMSNLVQQTDGPVVFEIKPIEDLTGQNLDLTIYPRTIREKLMNMGGGQVVFRDETAREEVIQERIEQSDAVVNVTRTESSTISARRNSKNQKFSKGGAGMVFDDVDENRKADEQRTQQVKVTGRIADVDYFLKGFIYLQDERTSGVKRYGYRYYRFQFRLTDARSGLMVWEKSFELKTAGDLYD